MGAAMKTGRTQTVLAAALTAVMIFFTLADTGANENLPLITTPAQ